MKKILKVASFLCFSIFFNFAYAQDGDVQVLAGLSSILQDINNNLKDFSARFLDFNALTYDKDQKKYLAPKLEPQELEKIKEPARSMILSHQYPQGIYNTILQVSSTQGNPKINSGSQTMTQDAIQDIFTTLDGKVCPPAVGNGCQLRSDTIKSFAALKLSSPYNKDGEIDADSYNDARKPNNLMNGTVDVNSLLGPLTYAPSTDTQKVSQDLLATTFVKFITEQSLPLQIKTSLKDERDGGVAYIARLRNYVSHQSIDISNYSQMLARRVQVKNGKSQLQMEQEMATRRLNTDWHDQMEKAAPAVVQREILYLLAEINYQLYLSRVGQERLLATMTASHALQLQTALKPTLVTSTGVGTTTYDIFGNQPKKP